jgi:hypothetical protein
MMTDSRDGSRSPSEPAYYWWAAFEPPEDLQKDSPRLMALEGRAVFFQADPRGLTDCFRTLDTDKPDEGSWGRIVSGCQGR